MERSEYPTRINSDAKSSAVFRSIEKLLIALGAKLSEGKGSRVRVYLNEVRAVFHRPHPRKEADKGAIKSMKRFLKETNVRPEE